MLLLKTRYIEPSLFHDGPSVSLSQFVRASVCYHTVHISVEALDRKLAGLILSWEPIYSWEVLSIYLSCNFF